MPLLQHRAIILIPVFLGLLVLASTATVFAGPVHGNLVVASCGLSDFPGPIPFASDENVSAGLRGAGFSLSLGGFAEFTHYFAVAPGTQIRPSTFFYLSFLSQSTGATILGV
jgi:hypothetical protein